MAKRTDLALEQTDRTLKTQEGVEKEVETVGEIEIVKVKIKNKKAANMFKKPMGEYVTFQSQNILEPQNVKILEDLLTKELEKHVKEKDTVLFVGLGNRYITPDSVGPEVARKIVATRHLDTNLLKMLGHSNLKSVSVIAPGVLGQTGMETTEIVKACFKIVKPDLVIAVDALAAINFKRLGTTIQLTNTGICPGSGVENKRKELSKKILGVPVIAIGIPTVVDAPEENKKDDEDYKCLMMVTPKNIDLLVKRSAKVISNSVNKALFPDLEEEEIETFYN